ncbi:MAG: hypothetical protein ACF8OB_08745 [Phycisphaeraceae bacterium JB051]
MSDDHLQHLDAHKLTWAVLLGKWVEFARSAVGLPDDEQGNKLRQSVPDLIMLQAVWFALQHMDELSADQQALGLDRAGVLIDQHAQVLQSRWSPDPLPQRIEQLIGDAQKMHDKKSENHADAASELGKNPENSHDSQDSNAPS